MKLRCLIFSLMLCAVSVSAQNRRAGFFTNPSAAGGSSFTNTTAGLIAWYTFDDGTGTTATDSSGSGFNGTLSGSVLPTWITPGQIGTGSLSFDGTNSYVALGTQLKVQLSYTNAAGWTITMWLKPTMDRASATSQTPISSAQASADRMAWELNPGGASGSGSFHYSMYNGSFTAKHVANFKFTNTWVFCSMAWSNATTIFGYTNAVAATGTSAGSANSGALTQIGTSVTASASPFKGQIDDVRIYNRVVSLAEITNIFQWRP